FFFQAEDGIRGKLVTGVQTCALPILIPEAVDYKSVGGLGREAVEKLNRHRPRTFGQALRLDGVTPADLSLLSIHITQKGYALARSEERRVGKECSSRRWPSR